MEFHVKNKFELQKKFIIRSIFIHFKKKSDGLEYLAQIHQNEIKKI